MSSFRQETISAETDLRLALVLLAVVFSSCALFTPVTAVNILRVPGDYELKASDTTYTVFDLNTLIHLEFDLNGSNRIAVSPGDSHYLASGIRQGWYYADVIGANMWVRGMPVYLTGGDVISLEITNNYINVDGRPFFNAYQEKSTQYPFTPMLSLTCTGCTAQPQLKFDGNEVNYVPPWISITAGWHTIQIYSPFDNVQLYYRTLFDNYTVTRFDLYPVNMN